MDSLPDALLGEVLAKVATARALVASRVIIARATVARGVDRLLTFVLISTRVGVFIVVANIAFRGGGEM